MNRMGCGLLAVMGLSLTAYLCLGQATSPTPGAPPAPPRGGLVNPLAAALDADGNGEISADEMKSAGEALKKLDQNQDGKLTEEEYRGRRGMGGGPGTGGGPGMDGGMGMQRPVGQGAAFANPVQAKNDQEKAILDVLNDMDKNQRRGMMNVPAADGRLLRLLTEAIGAKQVVEVGTSNGYSGIWLCLALRTTGGKLTTYEIDAGRAKLARDNFKRAGVDKMVTLVEGDAHQTVTQIKEPIDLLFLDADKEGYIDYLNKLLPLVRPGGLIVAHNINPRMADPKYIEAITTNPELETLFPQTEGSGGVSVTLKKH